MTTEPALSTRVCPPGADTPIKRLHWWRHLESQWRAAFQLAFLGHTDPPEDEELEKLWQTPVLRFAGVRAPYPNMNFELTNCSGLAGMSNLEILVLTNHRIEAIAELASLPRMKSLFINSNQISSLTGIELLIHLEQLYAQANQIESLEPLRKLINLRDVQTGFNPLKNLDGITRKHADTLKSFYCLPSHTLTDREIMRVERNLGVRCRSL